MRILYFIGTLNHGGAEVLLLDICRQHAMLPYKLVCAYRKDGNLSQAYRETGAEIVKLEKKHRLLPYVVSLRKFVQENKIDIIHSQTPSNTLLCCLALVGMKTKVVTTFHGHSFADAKWLYRKLVYRRSAAIVCVSKYEKAYYEKKWNLSKNNKLNVVPNGVDFSKLNIQDGWTKIIDKKPGIVNLCMVGNFQGGRSPLVVCKALTTIKNVHFYFIGKRVDAEGWRYDECVAYCKTHGLDNVHFLGGRNDVPQLLQLMDGFVYSTEHDTFGIAVVEAIAAGLPVIVNDWEVMKEVTHNGEWATLFKTEDIADCANKIEDLVAHLPERKAKAQQIAKEVRKEYSIEKHIERLNEIYNTIGI